MCCLLPAWAWAQTDTIPRVAAGMFDWARFKQEMKAPLFQQNDMAIYILRKDSLMEMIAQEENAAWIKDFHFVDVNGDRWLDAVYSGETKSKGFFTYFMLADTGLRFPVRLAAPGYVHLLRPSKTGVEFILREDAKAKGAYLHKVTQYFYRYDSARVDTGWQVQLLATTEVPILRKAEVFELKEPADLRAQSRIVNAPPMDHDQDGKPETAGNLVAQLEAGMPLLRYAEVEHDGHKWSFVLVLATPTRKSIFRPMPGIDTAIAGWVPTEAITGKH